MLIASGGGCGRYTKVLYRLVTRLSDYLSKAADSVAATAECRIFQISVATLSTDLL